MTTRYRHADEVQDECQSCDTEEWAYGCTNAVLDPQFPAGPDEPTCGHCGCQVELVP